MKIRSNITLYMAAAIMWLLPASDLHASGTANSPSTTESGDTLLLNTAKGLIESATELSKAANKLSEAALKLIENQNATEESVETDGTTDGSANAETTNSVWGKPWHQDGVGGHYVWVPDGEPDPTIKTTADKPGLNEPDLNEKTFWHGDSIPMAIPTKRFGRFDRKLYNWLIYPKGQWHLSLSANYGELSTDDSELLSLLKDIDVHGIIYSIKPSVSYFFKNNINAGIRLAFTKGELGIGSFKVDIDEDMNFNLHDIKYTSESYSAAIFLQQHFGLSRRGRFSVYNEVEIAAGTGNKHFIRPFDGDLKDTRTKTQTFNINYSPGVSIMMMKNAAFNLSFGIFGFHLQNEKQWENGEESGNRFTSGINFRFNIFNINFGVSIII